jgi:hypothetical protein
MFLTLGAVAILILVGYLASVYLHPFRSCRWCKASGKHWGAIYAYSHRPCVHCGGSGRRPRFGTKFVNRPG